jgi:uncharacterized protein (DUF58 family)
MGMRLRTPRLIAMVVIVAAAICFAVGYRVVGSILLIVGVCVAVLFSHGRPRLDGGRDPS